MYNIFSQLLAVTDIQEVASKIHSIVLTFLMYGGIALLIVWCKKTAIGSKALLNCPVRRNSLSPILGFVPFFVWFFSMGILAAVFAAVSKVERPSVMVTYAATIGGSLIAVFVCFAMAKLFFCRGIKGLGISLRTWKKDVLYGFLSQIAIQPVVFVLLFVMMRIGIYLNFEVPSHELINQMTGGGGGLVSITAVVVAVIAAPVAEELMFRGFIQTSFSNITGSRWGAIFLTSAIFAIVHGNTMWTHWPALFALSCCLGYSYEKSGSIIRPVVIHFLFNSTTVLSAFLMKNIA